MEKISKKQIDALRKKFKRCKVAIKNLDAEIQHNQDRLSGLKREHDHIMQLACDCNFDSGEDGAHRPHCSVSKLL